MHLKFTRVLATLISLCVFVASASAKIWRVNNNAGVAADFNNLATAFANASVLAGDTLYIEPSATNYGNLTLSKRLVLIGAGYFLSGAGANPGLQVNPNATNIVQINCMAASSGSQLIGLSLYVALGPDTDDLTISRCNVIVFPVTETTPPNPKISNLVITKCWLDLRMSTHAMDNPKITNCIVSGTFTTNNVTNGLIRNNVFRSLTPVVQNSYISNNIFTSTSSGTTFSNCTLKYNIATVNMLPTDPTLHNVNNVPYATVFVGTGSTDGQFQLLPGAGNPAIGGGEPINGITPDCGAFGTADPYRLSGIPPIPTIYALTVPNSVPASATSMDITISTRANN